MPTTSQKWVWWYSYLIIVVPTNMPSHLGQGSWSVRRSSDTTWLYVQKQERLGKILYECDVKKEFYSGSFYGMVMDWEWFKSIFVWRGNKSLLLITMGVYGIWKWVGSIMIRYGHGWTVMCCMNGYGKYGNNYSSFSRLHEDGNVILPPLSLFI